MPKGDRQKDSGPPDDRGRVGSKAPAPPRAKVRPWLLLLALAVAASAAVWSAVGTLSGSKARDAINALQPVAASIPSDQPERREAMEVADRLLEDFPGTTEALFARGILLSRYGFNDEAVKSWQACLAMVPDLAPAYERLGIQAFQRGENEEAVELLRKAVELDPETAAAGLYLGEALNNLGRMEEAVPVLEQFLKISPRSPEPHFQLGQAYLYLKDYERAKQCHEAALRADPEFAQACYGLAQACERLGETDKSREYREKYQAMIARSRVAETRRVRQDLDKGQVQQSLADAYATAAKIYQANGRTQEAEELWNKAAALDPSGKAGGATEMAFPQPNRLPSGMGR